MKKIGLTLLTAFAGGAMALGTYKVIEDKYSNSMSFEDRKKFISPATNPGFIGR
jgi:serine protease Do